MLELLLMSWLHLTVSLTQKDATLNAQTTSQNGASIHHNSNTVTISNTDYHINVNAQEEDYDLKLSLNNSWSFQSSVISTITLTLNGETPHPDKDTDFLIVFSVNDKQYFSFFAHLDITNNIKCRIYGSISLQNITRSVSEWISDNTIHARWDRISNNNKWLIVSDGFNKQAIWPLKFIIINNPINNQIIFQFYNQITQTYATQYIFENVFFIPNTPIDIFVMGDSNGEQFIISSLSIQLSYNQSTTTIPSISPTKIPSNIPSKIPSNFPTQIPTNFPTESDNIILTIQYRIIITITFGYKLSINDTYKIVSVLNDITNKIINKTCLNSTIIEHENPNDITIINATIFVCNVSTNDNFEQQFLQNINQQSELDIIKNKTNIEIIITDDSNNIINNNNKTIGNDIATTTNYFIQTNENNKQNNIIGTETELMIFIKIIGLQLVLCCLMSICVFTLKYRTKRLKNKRNQISQKVNQIITNKSQNITVNDNESVTNECTYTCNDDRISNLHLSGKRKLKFMKLKSNTNEPHHDIHTHQSYYHSQITKQLHNTQRISDENLCILSILQSEGNKHIPQESDTIKRQKQHVALQQLKSRHQIISGISTDDLPSIPNTQTFTIDEITKSTILSPTFTYKINGRQRGVV